MQHSAFSKSCSQDSGCWESRTAFPSGAHFSHGNGMGLANLLYRQRSFQKDTADTQRSPWRKEVTQGVLLHTLLFRLPPAWISQCGFSLALQVQVPWQKCGPSWKELKGSLKNGMCQGRADALTCKWWFCAFLMGWR